MLRSHRDCRLFPRHVRKQDIARFLVKHELFQLSMYAIGSIVECGVLSGGGLASWHHFSSFYDYYNHASHIIGFDPFICFPVVYQKTRHQALLRIHMLELLKALTIFLMNLERSLRFMIRIAL